MNILTIFCFFFRVIFLFYLNILLNSFSTKMTLTCVRELYLFKLSITKLNVWRHSNFSSFKLLYFWDQKFILLHQLSYLKLQTRKFRLFITLDLCFFNFLINFHSNWQILQILRFADNRCQLINLEFKCVRNSIFSHKTCEYFPYLSYLNLPCWLKHRNLYLFKLLRF